MKGLVVAYSVTLIFRLAENKKSKEVVLCFFNIFKYLALSFVKN